MSKLCVALLASLVVHVAVLALPVLHPLNSWSSRHVDVVQEIQVSLLPAILMAAKHPPELLINSGKEAGQVLTQGAKSGVPAVPVFVEARLLSDINLQIEDPSVFGFMILNLEVDAEGKVISTSTIHSDLPRQVVDSVEQVFAAARFKPAELDGEKQGTTVQFRIDVD